MTSATANTPQLLAFDPFSHEFRDNPYPWQPRLLEEAVGFMTMEGIPSAWVARYADCLTVLRDWESFSSVKPKNLPGMEKVDFFNGQPVMNYSDPPDHTRLRNVINVAFSPRRMQEITESTAILANEILDGIRAGQAIDAVNDITKKYAMRILLNNFLNVEDKDQHIFMKYVASLYLLDQVKPGEPKPQAFLDAWDAGREYCRYAIANARKNKTQDLIGLIVAAEEGGSISDNEMMAMMVVLFTGGVSTMASAGTSSLYYLASNPAIAERVRQEPALAKKVVEESLRLDPPVTLVMRFATRDVELGGKTILKGMPVYTLISVANRDPAEFPDPDRFDIDRKSLRHMSFGNGIHTCIGNSVTRNVMPLLIQGALNRFPDLRVDNSRETTWETTARSRHRGFQPLMT